MGNLLSYQGQAELGYGAAGTPYMGDRSAEYAAVDKALNAVSQQALLANQQVLNQKIADRNETLALVNEQNVPSDVLEQDRPLLDKRLIEIKNKRLANPDIKANPKAFTELQGEIKDFNNMAASSKARAIEVKKMKLDYAGNPDEEYRQALGAHIKDQVDRGVMHPIDPYQKMQDWDETIFAAPAVVPKQGELTKDKNGLFVRHNVNETPLSGFDSFYDSNNMVEGADKNMPNKIVAFYKHAIVNPAFMSDQNLTAINNKIDEINKRNGLSQGQPGYRDPIATKDGETGQWVPTTNPAELVKGVALLRNYKYDANTIVDDKAQKAALTQQQTNTQIATQGLRKAQIDKARADAAKARAEIGTIGARGKLYENQAYLAKQNGDLARAKTLSEKSKGAYAADEAITTFKNLSKDGSFTGIDKVPGFAEKAKQLGFDDGFQFADVTGSGAGGSGAEKILSVAKPFKNGRYDGTIKPLRVFMAKPTDGDVSKTRLIGLMPDGSLNVVTQEEAAGNIIRHETGFVRNPQTSRLQDVAAQAMREASQDYAEDGDGTDEETDQETADETGAAPDPVVATQPTAAAPAPKAAPVPAPTAASTTKMASPKSKGRVKNGKPEIQVNGKWYRAIAKTPAGDIIYQE